MQTETYLELRQNGIQHAVKDEAELASYIKGFDQRGGLKPDARLYAYERRPVSLEGE